MTVGMSATLANAWLDALCNNTVANGTLSLPIATPYLQLHTADPGAAGTTSIATETTRKLVSFGAAASGSIANDTAITWTGIAGSQDATHFSLWTASSGGTFLGSGTITANAYTAGDTYNVAIGAATLTLGVAA